MDQKEWGIGKGCLKVQNLLVHIGTERLDAEFQRSHCILSSRSNASMTCVSSSVSSCVIFSVVISA